MAKIKIDNKLMGQLNHIPIKDLASGEYDFPDFLLIGPQRTGTTWLHRNLILHPDIYMPPEKELYYFNNLIKEDKEKRLNSTRFEWYTNHFNPTIKSFINLNKALLKSYRSLMSCNLNLIKHFSPTVKGEATASYAVMRESIIQDIISLNPKIKIIITLRNPIERAWSHAKKDLLKEKKLQLEQVAFTKFKEFYSDPYMVKCGMYSLILKTWVKCVGQNNVLILDFNDISKSPQSLLKNVFDFLNVPPTEMIKNSFEQKVINPTSKLNLPEEHQEHLKDIFRNEIKIMNADYNVKW